MLPRARRLLAAAALALVAAACGRMGDPIPPGEALLAAPGTPSASGREDRILLRWPSPKTTVGGKRAEDPAGYRVERSDWPFGQAPCDGCPETAALLGETEGESFTDTRLREGFTYRYRVVAVDDRGRAGRPSPPVTLSWRPLPAPVIHAEPVHEGARIVLDSSPVAPAPYALVGLAVYDAKGRLRLQIPAGAPFGELAGLANDVPETFECRWALKAPDGSVLESAPAALTVIPRDLAPPAPPKELIAMGEIRAISLHWLPAPGEPYAQVAVQRSPEGGDAPAWTEIARVVGAFQYTDANLEPGARYRYRVIALDAAGNASAPSPVSSARSLSP